MGDRQNDQVSPAGRRRLRWAGLALVMLVLLTVLGIGAVLDGLPGKVAGRDGAHSTAENSLGPVDVLSGFVIMSVGGPLFHAAASIARADYTDISATMDSRKFSRVNARSVTRIVFTSVAVYEVDPASARAPKLFRLVLTMCDADYMSWFLYNATAVTIVEAGAHASQVAPSDACYNPHGVSNLAVDRRWHFSSAPADPAPAA